MGILRGNVWAQIRRRNNDRIDDTNKNLLAGTGLVSRWEVRVGAICPYTFTDFLRDLSKD